LCAQSETGQLVSSVKLQQLRTGSTAGPLGDSLHTKLSGVANEPYFKGMAMQFIKPEQTTKSFFYWACARVPQNLFTLKSGWVCRQEWKFEKITSVPFKFRLGSMEMVDHLEGKDIHR
jgi:hypothetical protein